MNSTLFEFDPVGIYHSGQKYRYETPRQGVFSGRGGYIDFKPGVNFEEALRDLDGFSRIWILFCFHLNSTWKPKVQPPVSPERKRIGVFATRSPHRPNPIGMSCVTLEQIEGLRVYIGQSDLLDETPVLDIKPYIPAADSFPESRTGWLEAASATEWQIHFMPEALIRFRFLQERTGLDLENFCRVQLTLDPLRSERKRIFRIENRLLIGCRTWRIEYSAENGIVEVKNLFSGYTAEELNNTDDPYTDKKFHREFVGKFGAL